MGCQCCRMVQCFGFEEDGPSPDYINDVSKQKPKNVPDVQQIEPHFDVLKTTENKQGHYGSQDDHRNTGVNAIQAGKSNRALQCDAKRNGDISNTSLYASARKEVHGEVTRTLPGFEGNCHIGKGISQEQLLGQETGLEFYTNGTLASEQPESLQDEICQSVEGSSSLTESAILDIRHDTASQPNTHYRNDCYETDSPRRGYSAGGSSERVNCVYPDVDYLAPNLPLHVDSKFASIGFQAHAPTYRRSEEMDDEDIDSDVAEALAALAAAIAEECSNEDDFTGRNEYGY